MQKNGWALLPVGVFLLAFIGSGIVLGSFQAMPAVIAFLLALTVAFFQNPKRSFTEKLDDVTRGMGDDSIMLMCLIFLLAGGFSGVAQAAGCVESTVGFFLTVLPPSVSVGGIFLIGCLVSTAMGTSIGTIAALTPVAAGISQKTGIAGALCIGAVLSGAMFGDNLSMISDTTIAATKALGCSARDKFRENLKIVFPGAILAFILYLTVAKTGQSATVDFSGEYNLWHLLPYIAVLSCSLAGFSVIPVLILGIVLCLLVGVATGKIAECDIISVLFSGPDGNSGIQSMYDMMAVSMVVAGVIGLVRANGGIDYLLEKISHRIRSPRAAQFGIAAIASAVDFATANNTVAVVVCGPIVKEIMEEYSVAPRRAAAILDIFTSLWQGILPYSSQMLYACAGALAAGIDVAPTTVIRYAFYPAFMGISTLLFLLLPEKRHRNQRTIPIPLKNR